MKNISKILYTLFFLIFFLNSYSQEETAPKKDTVDAPTALIISGNNKCDSAEVHLKKKEKKIADKLFADALKDYKKSLKLNKTSYVAYYRMGLLQSKTDENKDAIISFTTAIKLDSTHGEA